MKQRKKDFIVLFVWLVGFNILLYFQILYTDYIELIAVWLFVFIVFKVYEVEENSNIEKSK